MTCEQTLFSSLDANTTILTPNRRLAATLHKKHHLFQQNQHQLTWATPDILPFTSWCQRLWQEHTGSHFIEHPLLLTLIHEQFIWESILSASKESHLLLQVAETADITRSAWSLIKQWQIDLEDPAFKATEDSYALYKWLIQFKHHCQTKKWLDQSQLMDVLATLCQQQILSLPKRVILIGFTEINPQQRYFLEQIKARASVEISNLSAKNQGVSRLKFAEQEAEIFAMARWAKAQHLKDKNLTIGCVLPELDKARDRVAQIFAEIFADQTTTKTQAYNISAGKPLTEYPVIHTAFLLLNLYRSLIYTENFSHILLSPFLGNAEAERINRVKYELLLRKNNINRINLLEQLKTPAITHNLQQHIPLLTERLQAFFDYLKSLEPYQSYNEWAHIFNHLLTILGWPGERSLNSEEYQTVDQWLKLLKQFISLDQISEKINLTQALLNLQKLARRQIFQPKSPDAPIQVLGLLEAAGVTFDALWVSGMDDVSWPPQPKPNPLIPKRLQRELLMPHASAARELNFSKSLTKQFCQSATHVYFSYSMQAEDLELQPSPLIQAFPELAYEELVPEQEQIAAERIYNSKTIHYVIDSQGSQPQEATVRGGINVIKQQALCPFKAYSEWRLFAREIEKPMPGLRSKDRGTILHKVLEILWGQLKSHANLIQLNFTDLNAIIIKSTEKALDHFPLPRSNSTTYLHLEKLRIHKLMHEWLEIEKARPPFTVIAHEQQVQIHLNQLHLNVKIDRIDMLEDGKKLIIDYKTGVNNDINGWLSDRPEEPQLPLYALHDTANIVGLSFAQIAPGEHKFIGVSQYDLGIPGIKPISALKKLNVNSWEEQIAKWQVQEKLELMD